MFNYFSNISNLELFYAATRLLDGQCSREDQIISEQAKLVEYDCDCDGPFVVPTDTYLELQTVVYIFQYTLLT